MPMKTTCERRRPSATSSRPASIDWSPISGARRLLPARALAGGAERAAGRTADLRGDAERRASNVPHDHRLDGVAAIQLVELLGRKPRVGLQAPDLGQGADSEGGCELAAERCRKVEHL